jgi:site-specific DNA recombinase
MIKVRCAIYTRKSSEEGLEQAFNSLDAQREACAAYILSQASEGWVGLPAIYDDGGLSGGTLERPALKRLLADIAAGEIDIIVVYKAGTSFVSVTQSFNTTTSMGRLTLNMLLSFAQFEREVTAERIRDKIAASKAKGMWMGGTPPLGYRPDERTLAIVDGHAELIRKIYRRYLALGSVRELADELNSDNQHVPVRTRANGRTHGGGLWSRGQLYSILKNPMYIGEIQHRDQIYMGKHPSIIDRALWDDVQADLADHCQNKDRRSPVADSSLLAGKVYDEAGQPLIAVHASKQGRRYRYYVSKALHHGVGDKTGARVPARELEKLVADRSGEALTDLFVLLPEIAALTPLGMAASIKASERLALQIRAHDPELIADLVERVTLSPTGLTIRLSATSLASLLGLDPIDRNVELHSEARLKRCGMAVRLVRGGGSTNACDLVDIRLVRLLVRARGWWADMQKGDLSITDLAKREGVTTSYVTRVVRLAFLAPDIVDAITMGKASLSINGSMLSAPGSIALSWQEQRRALAL